MKNKSYVKIILPVLLLSVSGVSWAAGPDLKTNVERAVVQVVLGQEAARYAVTVSLDWKKEVTMGDLMLRAPRRPARKDQVIQVKQKNTVCRGILANQGTRVLMPAVCLREGKYQLDKLTFIFQNGRSYSQSAQHVAVKEEVAWADVPAELTAGIPSATVSAVPQGQSLQDFYGAGMTSHLRSFFHAKKVTALSRTRPGKPIRGPELQLGDALVYQGRVVALVKKVVSSYGNAFGGVSESAFAVLR